MFWFLFQPVEAQGCTQVSGSSASGNGPPARSPSRMSRRQALLVFTHSLWVSFQPRTPPAPGHSAISARQSAMSSATSVPRSSMIRCSSTASHSSCGE
jgi:hypothetical protein